MPLDADYAAHAAAPASPRAYALLFSARPRREALTALYAIDAEIDAASAPHMEHTVAHTKLGWWRAETDRLRSGRPEHPASRALYEAAGDAPDYALLHERIAAADLRLACFTPSTAHELDALLYRSHGAVQQLAAQVLAGARSAELDRFGALLGRGIGLTDVVRDLRQDVIDGAPRIPADAIAAAPGALDNAHLAGDHLRPLLEPLTERARAALAEARQALTARDRAAQSHGYVLAALHDALLDSIRAARFDVSSRRAVHPLRQLWIAWRAARRT